MHGSGLWEFENGGQEHALAAMRLELLMMMDVAKTDLEVQALGRIRWRVETVQHQQEMRNAVLDSAMT